MTTVLELKTISFSYKKSKEKLLENISLSLESSHILGIIGPNGAGKTTLLNIIIGLIPPDSGEVKILDRDILTDFPHHKISYVPQFQNINTALPVRIIDFLNFSKITAPDKIDIASALNIVGLKKDHNDLLHNLSGGEKQRVLLAKALLKAPSLLILDEPTQGLDTKGQDQLLSLIQKIKTEYQTAILIVDHNINQIMKFCDKILCLNKTFHWHDRRDLVSKDILEKTYHCEFEHLLIHEKGDINIDGSGHDECHHHDNAREHEES